MWSTSLPTYSHGSRCGHMTSCSSPSGSLTCRGRGFRAIGYPLRCTAWPQGGEACTQRARVRLIGEATKLSAECVGDGVEASVVVEVIGRTGRPAGGLVGGHRGQSIWCATTASWTPPPARSGAWAVRPRAGVAVPRTRRVLCANPRAADGMTRPHAAWLILGKERSGEARSRRAKGGTTGTRRACQRSRTPSWLEMTSIDHVARRRVYRARPAVTRPTREPRRNPGGVGRPAGRCTEGDAPPGFWSLVRSCLAPRGRVFLIDNRIEIPGPNVIRRELDLELRRVHDGREFQVIEVFYEPEELRSLLRDEGWTASLDATRWFIFGEASPSGARQLVRPEAAPNAR